MPVFLDPEFVLAEIGDRPVVAIEGDDIELDEVDVSAETRRVAGDGDAGQSRDHRHVAEHSARASRSRGPAALMTSAIAPMRFARHRITRALRITAIAPAVTPSRSSSSIATQRTSAASVPCTAAAGASPRTRQA